VLEPFSALGMVCEMGDTNAVADNRKHANDKTWGQPNAIASCQVGVGGASNDSVPGLSLPCLDYEDPDM
jgi:hypothetical protein